MQHRQLVSKLNQTNQHRQFVVFKTYEVIAVTCQQQHLFNCLSLEVVKYRFNLDAVAQGSSSNS
ncbi:MAG: hypothetical protein AAFQ14_08720 [Cyanobacteria bacterium J06621_12]